MNDQSIKLSDDDFTFLAMWEEVYKKSMLTFWVLYHLSIAEMDAGDLYTALSDDGLTVNEHSLYRLLRRFYDVNLIDQTGIFGKTKLYRISDKGDRILSAFITRNIDPLSIKIAMKGEYNESHTIHTKTTN